MKFYKSTAGCGDQQYAYVTPVKKSKNGYDYLCIWTNENSGMIHVEGEIVEDLEDIYLEEVEINIDDYPISNTFLFKFFMQNINKASCCNDNPGTHCENCEAHKII